MIGKIVKRNSRVTEVAATVCKLPSPSHREMIESAMVRRRDLNDQGPEG